MTQIEIDRRAATGNPFLDGAWAPMDEEMTLSDLLVTGTIPDALTGVYLRIGPNPVSASPLTYNPFVGDGMVHGLALSTGKACWYRNRWIRSTRVAKVLGVDPAPGPRRGGDTVNTSVVAIGGRPYALIEAGSYPVALAPDLGTQTYDTFGGTLSGAFSAHPHRDPLTGESHAICYDVHRPGTITHVVIDPAGAVVREEAFAVPGAPMIHDCAITARYAIVLDLPVTFAPEAGPGFPYRWTPEKGARVGLLPRRGGADDIIWCALPPAFVFHVVNAWDEDDGTVTLDLCVYHAMFADGMKNDGRMRGLERWSIDPTAQTVSVATLDPAPQEFPRIDERCFGQRHRHVWTVAAPADDPNPAALATALFHHDLVTGTRQVRNFGTGRFPGEFVFVPRTPDAPEGDGWLMGFVIDTIDQHSEFTILDTLRFDGEAEAIVTLPHLVPSGFHGDWIPAM